MNILLKCVGAWLLVLWHKENVWVLCTDDGSQNYTRNDHTLKLVGKELVDLFSPGNNTDKLKKNANQVKSKDDFLVNSTVVTEKNKSVKNIINMEGGGDVTLYPDISQRLDVTMAPSTSLPLSSYDRFSVIDRGNRSSSIVPRKGVTYNKPKIVPRKGVDSSNEENSSSMESTDENLKKDSDFLHRKCFCCATNISTVVITNESDNCSRCCDAVKNGESILHSVSNINNTVEPVNPLPSHSSLPSALNLTTQDSTQQHISDSVKPNMQHFSSSNSTATLISSARNKKPLVTLDAANDSPASLSSQASSRNNDFSRTDYVIPVVCVILAVPLVIVLAVFLYKKSSEFWERRHYRRMDFLIDGMYND